VICISSLTGLPARMLDRPPFRNADVCEVPNFELSICRQESLMIGYTSLSFFSLCRIKRWPVSCLLSEKPI